MALDKVIEDILSNTQAEYDRLIREAESEKAKILQEADQRIEKNRKAQEKELQETLKRLRRQELSSAELESKRIILNKKKDILDKTFTATLQDLSSMDPKDRARIYKKILAGGKKLVQHPRVYVPKNDAALLTGIRGCEGIHETDMEPGLILESQDGKVRLDYRFKTILENVWEKELKNVSDSLFG